MCECCQVQVSKPPESHYKGGQAELVLQSCTV